MHTALVRVDFNIESKNDTFRLKAALPTITALLESGHRVVLLSHRGRPRQKNPSSTLEIIVKPLSKLLKQKVAFIPFTRDFKKIKAIIRRKKEKVILLENLRFHPGEEKNTKVFAKNLASLGDFFINEAFSSSHRKHASIVGISEFLPAFAGMQFEEELWHIEAIKKNPWHPFVLIIGGVKVGDKAAVIERLLKTTDHVLLGGGVANTFFAARGLPVGKSRHDEEFKNKIPISWKTNKKIVMPEDVIIEGGQILDVGPKTIQRYQKYISKAHTVVWSGPMGYFEKSAYANGTKGIWKALIKNRNAEILIGGGETVASHFLIGGKIPKNIFLSTGGSAMLQYLADKKLPGIEALK